MKKELVRAGKRRGVIPVREKKPATESEEPPRTDAKPVESSPTAEPPPNFREVEAKGSIDSAGNERGRDQRGKRIHIPVDLQRAVWHRDAAANGA